MIKERSFLDTAFIQALLNPRDDHHNRAKSLMPRVRNASEIWVTEAVLVEVENALSSFDREGTFQFIQKCYYTHNIQIVSVNIELFTKALVLYHSRLDKSSGLTDCISFVVMKENNITDALTTDRHFIQAGFRAVMLGMN